MHSVCKARTSACCNGPCALSKTDAQTNKDKDTDKHKDTDKDTDKDEKRRSEKQHDPVPLGQLWPTVQ